MKMAHDMSISFTAPRTNELNGLIHNCTFKIVWLSSIPTDTRVFGSRFVDEIKKASHGYRLKSRFVAQIYFDEGATSIATKAPTVKRLSQRLIMSIVSCFTDLAPFTRDVTQVSKAQPTSNSPSLLQRSRR